MLLVRHYFWSLGTLHKCIASLERIAQFAPPLQTTPSAQSPRLCPPPIPLVLQVRCARACCISVMTASKKWFASILPLPPHADTTTVLSTGRSNTEHGRQSTGTTSTSPSKHPTTPPCKLDGGNCLEIYSTRRTEQRIKRPLRTSSH